MKLLTTFLISTLIITAPRSCNKSAANTACYKGQLAVKGICSNYTIKVLEGAPTDWTVGKWTDEQTNKNYTQVFRLANPCNFPENIKEGDTFYFTVDTSKQEPCNTCMAFYPTPEKAMAIKVISAPCK